MNVFSFKIQTAFAWESSFQGKLTTKKSSYSAYFVPSNIGGVSPGQYFCTVRHLCAQEIYASFKDKTRTSTLKKQAEKFLPEFRFELKTPQPQRQYCNPCTASTDHQWKQDHTTCMRLQEQCDSIQPVFAVLIIIIHNQKLNDVGWGRRINRSFVFILPIYFPVAEIYCSTPKLSS